MAAPKKVQAPVKQFMRGISKIGRSSPELQESENIWLISDVDAYLDEWIKNGYELAAAHFVYNTEKAYYIHYVMTLRVE